MIKFMTVVFALLVASADAGYTVSYRGIDIGASQTRAISDQTTRFTPVEGADLKSRFDAAIKQARSRSKQSRFWICVALCPRAVTTHDLPLRSRIYEPFVFNSYEKA